MALKLFNTLTRKKEEFKPIYKGEVKIYSCGPTVYAYAHIGNFRCYIFNDLLRKYLKYKGFKVKQVMNLTDVDDKTIRDSQKAGKSLKEFTEFYTNAFVEDMMTLNCEIPERMPKATEHISEMIQIVKKLIEKKIAYKSASGTWYYKISLFNDYGKLANLDVENMLKNADKRLNDADEYEKENARDFALWKAYEKKDGDVFWETDIGKGRPGWHIECSAMSMKYLGETFDIHTGGVDLIFPHHTNEIAQSEGATGKKFVNYWLHNAHLIVNGEKMSKSLGNFFTLRDLMTRGYDAKSIRYELLKTHYRQQMDFREDELKQIPETLQKFWDFLDKLEEVRDNKIKKEKQSEDPPITVELIRETKKNFEKAMDDDLNISGALAAIFEFMNKINKLIADKNISRKEAEDVKKTMLRFDEILGVMEHEKGMLNEEEQKLIDAREKARKNKDWKKADELRAELKEKGIILEDTQQGARWKRIN